MSVQFGEVNFDGKPIDPKEFRQLGPVLAPYGSDGEGQICKGNFGLLYRAFHTTKESKLERQPHLLPSGAVLMWDGRLDNRDELITTLQEGHSSDSPDLSLVASAYEHWGTNSFAKLVGDWAISIWDPSNQSLILARDIIGIRHLYYSIEGDRIRWCTLLDPLVLFARHSFALDEEYIAGWLSLFPAPHLTPYVGIHSVGPSSSVVLRCGKRIVNKYWDFNPAKRIRYRTDAEYEEHFRSVFSESVRLRLRSQSPVLAELSGGMDSSSIVCMADRIVARGSAETRVDTVSYYDDSEPGWNERPYFTKVEELRERVGCHIDVGSAEAMGFEFENSSFAASPGSLLRAKQAATKFTACLKAHGIRVVLAGTGGDEVMGGVPTAAPELEDLLARGRFLALARQLKVWALIQRRPWLHLLLEAVSRFAPHFAFGISKLRVDQPWLCSNFVERNRRALLGYETRLKLFGALPSFQENVNALNMIRRQLTCTPPPSDPCYERRYPYLDRNLLEFIYAIPREQLVRPGQRRSLMRRSLVGIVPDELLKRKRKAYLTRLPTLVMANEWRHLLETQAVMVSCSLDIVGFDQISQVLKNAPNGLEFPVAPLMRTLAVELWLRNLGSQQPNLVHGPLDAPVPLHHLS